MPGPGAALKPAAMSLTTHVANLTRAMVRGWPAGLPPLPKRPAKVMAFGDSDTTYLTGSRRLTW